MMMMMMVMRFTDQFSSGHSLTGDHWVWNKPNCPTTVNKNKSLFFFNLSFCFNSFSLKYNDFSEDVFPCLDSCAKVRYWRTDVTVLQEQELFKFSAVGPFKYVSDLRSPVVNWSGQECVCYVNNQNKDKYNPQYPGGVLVINKVWSWTFHWTFFLPLFYFIAFCCSLSLTSGSNPNVKPTSEQNKRC